MNLRNNNLVISLYKLIVYVIVITVFFIATGLPYMNLQNVPQVILISLLIYFVFFVVFLNFFGNFNIGKEKTKSLIVSTSIGIICADIFGYIVFVIGKSSIETIEVFHMNDIGVLALIIVVHIVIVGLASKFGNYIYFRINKPIRTLIIVDCKNKANDKIKNTINSFKSRYELIDIVQIEDTNLYKRILDVEFCVINISNLDLRKSIIKYCYDENIKISIVPDIEDILIQSAEFSVIDDIPVFEQSKEYISSIQSIMKRFLDISISLILLIITFPIMCIVALAIKIEDGGKVFFKQKRLTKNRKEFKVIKFRSMKENVKNYSSINNDDRITKVGKIIRKTRLDELPQFFNVLIGDMSIVGPRPEMIENVQRYEADLPEFAYRLRVKAGITGIAQIEGKYNSTAKDKLIMDLMYIENFSLWNDFKLMFRTISVVAKEDSTEAF